MDGGSGLRQAAIHAFDIILLDVMLPVLNGFEVTKRLRMRHIRTPILLLTGRDAPKDVVQGLDAGADDYLTKRLNSKCSWRESARARGLRPARAQPRRALPTFCWTPKSERRCAEGNTST